MFMTIPFFAKLNQALSFLSVLLNHAFVYYIIVSQENKSMETCHGKKALNTKSVM